MAVQLGKAVASDQDVFTTLAQELIAGNSEQLWSCGRGLAQGNKEPRQIWSQLLSQLSSAPADRRNPHVFRGFLNALHETNAKLTNDLLDEALEEPILVAWYPVLQTAVGVDKQGLDRLMRSLDLGKIWIGSYRNLVFGGITHQIDGKDFNALLLRIAKEPEGLNVAKEILYMRLSFDEGRARSSTSEIIDIGCELLRRTTLDGRKSVRDDYGFRLLARYCLIEEKGAAAVRELCRNLRERVSRSETHAIYHKELLGAIVGAQPLAALEGLCGDDAESLKVGLRIMEEGGPLRMSALDSVPQDELLTWCDRQPIIRYPALATMVIPFQSSEEGRPQWTSTARRLLEKAPDRVEVLKRFVDQFSPAGWSVSQAAILQNNSKLLDDLKDYPDATVREFVENQKARLAQVVETHVEIENLMQRDRDERFEY